MSRPGTTLIWIAGDSLVRADFAGGRRPRRTSVRAMSRPATDELALLVDAAVRAGAKPGRRVWVLSSELWTQLVDLPRAATEGMGHAQLADALAFEAEPLSGMPALDTSVGVVERQSDDTLHRRFWISACPSAELSTTADMVGRLGARLAGVVHPAGLPRALEQTSSAWCRVELWSDLTLIAREGAVELDHGGPLRPDHAEQRARQLAEATELLSVYETLLPEPRPALAARCIAEDEAARDRWLDAWAQVLAAGRHSAPVLRPPSRPLSVTQRVAAAVIVAAAVALTCWAHHRSVKSRQMVTRPTAAAPQLAQRLATTRRDVANLSRAVNAARPAAVQRARRRAAQVLEALATSLPRGARISRVRLEGARVVVEGQSLDAELPNALTAALARRLPEWHIAPPTKTFGAGTRVCQFALELRQLDPGTPGKDGPSR